MTVYAADDNLDIQSCNITNIANFVSENSVKAVGNARGMLISTVELLLEDLGGGDAKLFGEVLCHEQMKKIKLNMTLDQWNPETEDWFQVERFELEWLAEDYPDEELTMANATVVVHNLDRGEEYRLRAVAGAWDYDSNYYEVWSERTPSILVE